MKIEQNFSNYSAWHHRGRCLEALYQPITTISLADLLANKPPDTGKQTSVIPLETLDLEFQMVHSAFVTDPDDSSAWLYYRWLIAQLLKLTDPDTPDIIDMERTLNNEIEFFQADLLQLDPESKWILLTYAMLLEVNAKLQEDVSDDGSEIYSKLMVVDPMRKGFYQDVKDGHASILMETI